MNRICTDSFTNKKKTAIAFIQKSVLVLALFVIMAGTAYAGAFLTNPNKITTYTAVTLLDGTTVEVIDNSIASANWVSSFGGYTGDDYVGLYIGTFDGNDGLGNGNQIDLIELIKYFLAPEVTGVSLEGYAKDNPNDTNDDASGDVALEISINYNDSPYDWSVNNTIDFYSVKGSSEFALYYIPEGGTNGKYTEAHIGGSLSHFSVVKISYTPPSFSDVPEPATMMLFGFSLIGLAGMARRRNSNL